jgi:exodeoxyribonuclease V gamma subunit
MPLTMLTRLQADLVAMRPIPPSTLDCENDHTLQFHRMPSKRREVEEIYNILLGIIDHHKDDENPISPEDIVVMAPDIMEYAPYIESYFDREESILHYRLMDIALPAHDPCIRAVRKLLSLIGSRWESATLKDILHSELVQKRLGIELNDAIKLQRWIDDNDVVWGMDKAHHAESLTQSHCEGGIEIHQGTWDHFFERTLRGLVTVHEEGVQLGENDILPYPKIDLNDAELLGKWIGMLKNLYRQLKSIESTKATLFDWSKTLEELSIEFLGELSEEMERIFRELRQLAIPFPTQIFNFEAVLEWFEQKFQKEKTSYREHHINSVRFCSLLPMRAIPAKVIVLCGMSEGAFPRVNIETTQNYLKGEESADPKPKSVDFDRYLMLETILSTRRYLVFTYSSLEPSLIINELLDLLNRYYTLDNKPPNEAMSFDHAFHRYAPQYFQNGTLKSYSPSAYREAIAYTSANKAPLASFIPKFELTVTDTPSEEIFLPFKELERLAKSPLEFYYKHSLGIRLDEEIETKKERALTLHPIDKAVIPRQSLRGDAKEIILKSKKSGNIPEGRFGEIAERAIEVQSATLRENLKKCGIEPENIFDYTFEKISFFPPGLPKITLSGTIENISPEGLILHKKNDDKASLYAFLPRILLFHYLVKEQNIKAKPVIHFSGAGESISLTHSNPKDQIETYLCYWNEARVNPSPLAPEWIQSLLNNKPGSLDKRLNDPFTPIYDEYEKANKKFDIEHLMVSPWVEWARRIHDAPL